MFLGHRSFLVGVFSLQLLCACGGWNPSSAGSESGTIAPPGSSGSTTGSVPPPKAGPGGGGPSGKDDAVAATTSVGGTLSVTAGASQTVTVSFTTSDGLPISGFAVSGSLGTLPTGWSGPSSFTCAAVGPGSGCTLSLTYAPAAVDSGTMTLDCVYIDNAGLARTPGPCATLTYAATGPNNVAAYVSPSGEIDAMVGASNQTVLVNFTTDDGNAATGLAITTNLSALPSGWSSAKASFTCAIVSTGSGCQLPLDFAPTAAAAGTLSLNYSYLDNSGAARSGALNIPYAAITHDTVVASASPSGQITAVETSGSQSVSVTFMTDDGNAASALNLTSGLTALPPGWSSSAKMFSCGSISTGNGCQLQLTYAPTTLASGVLTLSYAYLDASGTPNAGLVNIPYAATTNDNVVGTASPTGQVNSMLGSPGQPVSVTFTTDDSRLATALQLTTSLAALPAGWSSTANSFGCSSLSLGSGCQLTLMYAPTALDSGTLTLNFAYLNNAGESKSGSVAIPYRTTTNDSVVATSSPPSLAVLTGSSNAVQVTFTTDDGNLASGLSADLTALAADWSSPVGTFTCASVSTGNGCQLALTYAPTAPANATLSFGFSYTNAAGTLKTGTVSIPYVASP
jgi:hypothetical protein